MSWLLQMSETQEEFSATNMELQFHFHRTTNLTLSVKQTAVFSPSSCQLIAVSFIVCVKCLSVVSCSLSVVYSVITCELLVECQR